MTAATAWRCCAAAGVVTFLCSWGFGRIPGLVACGPTGGLGPILAFEFVTSPADVAALFGGEPCRSTFVAAQKIGLLLDALGFIPAYTVFLCLAAIACSPAKAGAQLRAARSWAPAFAGERVVLMTIVSCLLIAGLADEIEGALLYRILSDLPGTQSTIDSLWWPVHAKFALLGAGTFGIGFMLLMRRGWTGILAGIIMCSALQALISLAREALPAMVIGFTIAWVTIMLAALLASLRPSLFSAPATPPPAPASPSA